MATPTTTSSRLRIAGTWTGSLEVDLATWTLAMLRAEVASRARAESPDCVNLICAGRVLKDAGGGGDDAAAAQSLLQLGLRDNAKILAAVVAADRGKAFNDEVAAQAERSKKLARLRDAADKLASRHSDGSVPLEDFNMELEDQDGRKIEIGSETDRKGLMVGLMFHARAKSLIKKEDYKDALEVLSMAEEAFSICDPKMIHMIDNVHILQLDIVWCYFMLRDISCLSIAGDRLIKARKGFERVYGNDLTRFRLLQAGRHAELPMYLRLELLEGVVAYHSGNFEQSRQALNSAQTKYAQLEVPDEALSLLLSMGYKQHAAKRALRMTSQDVQAAVDFLVEERAKRNRRREEDLQRRDEIMEQKKYGKTPLNKAVDIQKLKELVSIGFERRLAAEALRLNENDTQKALDLLTDPERNCELQDRLDGRKKLKSMSPTDTDIEEMVSMGYQRSTVMDAVHTSSTKAEALQVLESACAGVSEQADVPPAASSNGAGSSEIAGNEEDQRDEVMEGELAREINGDPLADYDMDVTKEGEAIAEYLALLDSTC